MKKFKYGVLLGIVLLICLSATMLLQAQDDPDRQAIIDAVVAATEPQIIQQFSSNDGAYTARVTIYPCVNIGEQENSYERLDIIDSVTDEVHLVAEQVINCGGLGGYGLWVTRWSENGEFLYYTDAREGQPDGGTFGWTPSIYRVNTADLTVAALGQVQFSPDGQMLIAWNPTQISVMSINEASGTTFDLLPADLEVITNVVWLPDVSGIIYIQSDSFTIGTRSAVTYIDLSTLQQSVLLDTGS